jgi:hypothetical protein
VCVSGQIQGGRGRGAERMGHDGIKRNADLITATVARAPSPVVPSRTAATWTPLSTLWQASFKLGVETLGAC